MGNIIKTVARAMELSMKYDPYESEILAVAAINAFLQAATEDGWRMRPDEAGPDMYDAGEAVLDNKGHIGDVYCAMLADPTAQFKWGK